MVLEGTTGDVSIQFQMTEKERKICKFEMDF